MGTVVRVDGDKIYIDSVCCNRELYVGDGWSFKSGLLRRALAATREGREI